MKAASRQPRRSQLYLLVCLVLAVLTYGVFRQANGFEFINYDDNLYVFENAQVQHGLTAETVRWAWTTVESGSWQPLVWISYLLDVNLQGTGPRGFHRTNLLLHIANVLLLYLVLHAATGSAWRSAFVAGLFAVHPLHVESVTWIAERKDLLAALFGFLALGAYVRYTRAGGWTWYAAMLAAFMASLMSKQMLVTFPFVLLLLDYWPLGRAPSPSGEKQAAAAPTKTRRGLVVEKLPLFAIVAAFSVLAYWTQARAGAVESLEKYSLATRLANAVVSYATYLRRTVWPVDLAVIYPHPGDAIPGWQVAASAAVLLAITALAVLLIRRRPAILVGWLWFLGTLVPVIGLVQIGRQQMSDRYTYIPLIGLFLAAAWAGPSWSLQSRRGKAAAIAGACALILLAAASFQQVKFWQNDVTLFEHAVAVTRNNVEARMNFASCLGKQGRAAEAFEQYRAALAIEPDNHYVHHNLGRAYQQAGEIHAAIQEFRAAVRLQPDYALGHYSLGLALLSLMRADEAIASLERSAELQPRSSATQYELGNAFIALRQWDKAAAHFAKGVELNRHDPQAHHNLGVALTQLGRDAEAVDHYKTAISLGLKNPMAYVNLAACLERLGKPRDSAVAFETAVRLAPGTATVHNEYGKFLARHGRRDLARRQFEAAVRIDPHFAEPKANLATLGQQPGAGEQRSTP